MMNMSITEELNLNFRNKMRFLFIFPFLIFSLGIFSQTNPPPPFHASLDCANSKNEIVKSNREKCTKLILVGPEAENYSIISANITFKVGDVLKEFVVIDGLLSKESLEQIKKSSAGSYFYLENVRAKLNGSIIVKSLPAAKIKIIAN